MNEREITLPKCGGRAWLRTRFSDGRLDDIETALLRHLPREALAGITRTTVGPKADAESIVGGLASSGFDLLSLAQAQKAADRDKVLKVVKRWASVFGLETDAELLLDVEGLAALDPADFAFLLAECEAAVKADRADPNATGGTSSSTSQPDSEAAVSPVSSTTP